MAVGPQQAGQAQGDAEDADLQAWASDQEDQQQRTKGQKAAVQSPSAPRSAGVRQGLLPPGLDPAVASKLLQELERFSVFGAPEDSHGIQAAIKEGMQRGRSKAAKPSAQRSLSASKKGSQSMKADNSKRNTKSSSNTTTTAATNGMFQRSKSLRASEPYVLPHHPMTGERHWEANLRGDSKETAAPLVDSRSLSRSPSPRKRIEMAAAAAVAAAAAAEAAAKQPQVGG